MSSARASAAMRPNLTQIAGIMPDRRRAPRDTAGSAGYGGNHAGQAAGSAGYGGGYANASNASYGGSGYGTGIPQPVPGLSFMEAVKICFSKYATFEGRARRSEYWFFVLFNILMSIALGLIGNIILGVPEDGGTNMLQNLYSLAVLVPSLAVFWRRMHDIGKSGAWFFINFIPLIGQIILLVFEVRDSEPGENKYGMSPKYPA